MHKVQISQFEGPLDLLLQLIENQKLNISEVSLAEVTEPFLQYIKQLDILEPTQIADWLGIAAKLLVIKSRALLPTLELEKDEDEEIIVDLESRLIAYKKYKEASKYLKTLSLSPNQSFIRTGVFEEKIFFFPDPTLSITLLYQGAGKILEGLRELDNLPKARIKEAISIQEKIQQLQLLISTKAQTRLSDLIKNSADAPEVIVTFLALLELIKQRVLLVKQDNLFGDIMINSKEN